MGREGDDARRRRLGELLDAVDPLAGPGRERQGRRRREDAREGAREPERHARSRSTASAGSSRREGKKDEAIKIFFAEREALPGPVARERRPDARLRGDGRTRRRPSSTRSSPPPQAPDPLNKKNLENMVKQLEEGKNIPK